jgi:8-oxo-dGTP pyrophosphatase MutT (NUDIX family)
MHRARILSLLDAYIPWDTVDAKQRDRIVAFVRHYSDCFERTQLVGHVTGSAWIVDAAGERVLLTHHKKLNKWLQLGGHADGESDVDAVALREATEESGIEGITPIGADIFDVDAHDIPARGNEPAHVHYDIRFAFRAPPGAVLHVSAESNDLAWVLIKDLHEYTTEPSMLRMRDKWLSRK